MPSTDKLATLRRIMTILRLILSNRHFSKKMLAEELEVHPRTVTRYLKALDEAGFQLRTDYHGHFTAYIRLRPEHERKNPLAMIHLTREELIQVYLLLSGVTHVGPAKTRDELWKKIHTAMDGEGVDSAQLSSMLTGFDKGYKSYEQASTRRHIASLLEALYKGIACKVTYQTPGGGKPSTYDIEPYQLFEFDGGLYCFCHLPWVKKGGRIRMLAVERIRGLELGEKTFKRERAVEKAIEAKKNRAFRITDDERELKVKLRFTGGAPFYVNERNWHPGEKKTHHKNGSLTLEFRASGRTEIVRWIRSWGPECEVLTPKDLREEVKLTTRVTAQIYE